MTRVSAAAVCAAILISVGGCSSGDPVSSPTSTPVVTATPTAVDPGCASIYAGVNAGRLAEGASLERVTVCGVSAEVGASTDPVVVVVTKKDEPTELAELARLLAQPDAPVDPDVVCTMELRIVADFTVVLADSTALAPHVPTDVCGKPDIAVVRMLEGFLAQGR
ncbi:MAG: hypothetical protein WCF04_01365 [Candidatus Nanopelagicales bacterium]